MKRIISGLIVALLVIGMLALAFKIQPVKGQGAQLPYPNYPFVSVYPYDETVTVNETFTVSVIAYNLTNAEVPDPYEPSTLIPLGNLYGFDIELTWDPTVIHCLNHTVTAPSERYSTPIPPSPYAGILHGFGTGNTTVVRINDIVNESGDLAHAFAPDVRAWFSYATLTPAKVFNGNGTLCTLTFKVLKKGVSPLQIVFVELDDVTGTPIGWSYNTETWLNPPRSGTITAPIFLEGPGDLDGDGKVDISDVILAVRAYGSVRGSPNWNPYADLAPPYGKIDILDLTTIAFFYGQKYPLTSVPSAWVNRTVLVQGNLTILPIEAYLPWQIPPPWNYWLNSSGGFNQIGVLWNSAIPNFSQAQIYGVVRQGIENLNGTYTTVFYVEASRIEPL